MLTFGIDFDDVLCDLNIHAVELANREHPMDPPLRLAELDSYGDEYEDRLDQYLDSLDALADELAKSVAE